MEWSLFCRDFILVLALSFIIGLEREEDHIRRTRKDEITHYFGGVRTFPLIGLLGLVLFLIDPESLTPYVIGLISLSALLLVSYWRKLSVGRPGITSEVAALVTYTLGPTVVEKPIWWPIGITVVTVVLLHSKPTLHYLTRKLPEEELITVSKFLLLIGVILPLLPKQKIPFLEISPYQIWLAVVAVSSISYASYLIQSYLFPRKGLILSGFLGGLYSSTATTVVIARRIRSLAAVSPIVLATGAMYLRLAALITLFNVRLGLALLPYFLVAIVAAGLLSWAFHHWADNLNLPAEIERPQNPLELTAALVFAFLFVAMVAITRWTLIRYGEYGLEFLAGIIGLVDIDPFILGIVQGKYQVVSAKELQLAIILASISNNLAKGIYAMFFGRLKIGGLVLLSLTIISALLLSAVKFF